MGYNTSGARQARVSTFKDGYMDHEFRLSNLGKQNPTILRIEMPIWIYQRK